MQSASARTRAYRAAHRLVAIGLAVSIAAPGLQSQPLVPPPVPIGEVRSIEINGLRRIEASAVRQRLGTTVGRPLDGEQLRRDLLAVRSLRVGASAAFEDVRVDVTRLDEGLVVRFIVVERPVIVSLDVELPDGDAESDAARERILLSAGDRYDPARVGAQLRELEAFYGERGYIQAGAEALTETTDDGDVRLRIVVRPRPRAAVCRLHVVGNEQLDDELLLGLLQTRERSLLTAFGGAGWLNLSLLDPDREALRRVYQDHGYPDVVVAAAEVELSRDERCAYVRFAVAEGARYHVGSVVVVGELTVSAAEHIGREVLSAPGDLLRVTAVEADLARLTLFYRDRGHARATVELTSERDRDAATMALTYDVTLGPVVRIGRIRFEGNTRTRDRVMRRDLGVAESDLYSASGLRDSLLRLQRAGLFDDVAVREVPTEREDVIDLDIRVVERDVLEPGARVGIGSDGSASVGGQLSTPNLFGRSQLLALDVEFGSLRNAFGLRFVEPRLRDTYWQLALEGFYRSVDYPDFERDSFGGQVGTGVSLVDGRLRLSSAYLFESVEVTATDELADRGASIAGLLDDGRTARLRWAVAWDTRDRTYQTTSGFIQSLAFDWASPVLGSQSELVRLDAASRWFFRVAPFVTLRLNAELGWTASTDANLEVPISERYFYGGPDTVRGFEVWSLGPSESLGSDPDDPASGTDRVQIGGTKAFLANIELEFPIAPGIGIAGVVFADAGNAFGPGTPVSFGLDFLEDDSAEAVLRTSVGFGLRWFGPSPVPLRLEWGFPLAPREGEETFVFGIGAGASF